MECSDIPADSPSLSDDEEDYDYDDFYCNGDAMEAFEREDPEYIEYACLKVPEVERLLQETMDRIVSTLNISSSLAKLLLYFYKWDDSTLIQLYSIDPCKVLVDCFVSAGSSKQQSDAISCVVCTRLRGECNKMYALDCGHSFCSACWLKYIETQLCNGLSITIGCMASGCTILCLEDFVLRILNERTEIRDKYEKLIFKDCVESHSQLRFCPGVDCHVIIKAHFQCGCDYHAPTSCETIRKWLTKCADDSETANYISAHTKDCPNCHSCIEKNGGCNHMQQLTELDFHIRLFIDWKNHGSEYYECSRYKENPSIAQEANHVKARRALEKYLHYYERYENHHKSLKLEEDLRNCIMKKIDEKVNGHEGTWIDWQYLHRAATLLTKCRYTLQYTYPYAYYMENGPRKQLFEYQQAQLEKEIEELSWKVERAESTERGDLETQMHVAECKRRTLLQDFFD
uniref:RBR-type E3 ubiquitin transferase n=1 Tax=Elaeophora elaphi TaxID=1147741 RepID=A0A0R3S546_9BILA